MKKQDLRRESASHHGGVINPLLLTIPELITSARTSRATVYGEINSGRLKTVKIGRRRYVTPQAAQEWIDRLAAESEVSA